MLCLFKDIDMRAKSHLEPWSHLPEWQRAQNLKVFQGSEGVVSLSPANIPAHVRLFHRPGLCLDYLIHVIFMDSICKMTCRSGVN